MPLRYRLIVVRLSFTDCTYFFRILLKVKVNRNYCEKGTTHLCLKIRFCRALLHIYGMQPVIYIQTKLKLYILFFVQDQVNQRVASVFLCTYPALSSLSSDWCSIVAAGNTKYWRASSGCLRQSLLYCFSFIPPR